MQNPRQFLFQTLPSQAHREGTPLLCRRVLAGESSVNIAFSSSPLHLCNLLVVRIRSSVDRGLRDGRDRVILMFKTLSRDKRCTCKIRRESSSMQQTDYQFQRPTPRKQESVPMHKSPTHFRHSPIGWWKKGSPTKQKLIWRLKQGLSAQLRFTMLGRNA